MKKARNGQNIACVSSMPIKVQAGLRVRKLALYSNRSYRDAFRLDERLEMVGWSCRTLRETTD